MTVEPAKHAAVRDVIETRLAAAWPGTSLAGDPTPLKGGFWASMFRVRLAGQPTQVPAEVVYRVAPDAAMGAKELAVQQAVADLGFATPYVRLAQETAGDTEIWSVMDFAPGHPPLSGLSGLSALAQAPRLFARMPDQLAAPMAALHALDPALVTEAVKTNSPTVAWQVEDVLERFAATAAVLDRQDLVEVVRAVAACRPPEGPAVICHGDLHPFNLLVDDDRGGAVTVVDWTGSILAEPAFDVAFTSLMLANPPLNAPRPVSTVVRWAGAALARRFVARYRALAPDQDLSSLDWYRALHGTRILIEVASMEASKDRDAAGHPFASMIPVANKAIRLATAS